MVHNNTKHAVLYLVRYKQQGSSIVVVVLTLTRIVKSVLTRQAPVTLELRYTPGKKHKENKGGSLHAYIRADAIHAFTRDI